MAVLILALGEDRLANLDQQVSTHLSGQHVVLFLKPREGGLQVTYSLLQTAHF